MPETQQRQRRRRRRQRIYYHSTLVSTSSSKHNELKHLHDKTRIIPYVYIYICIRFCFFFLVIYTTQSPISRKLHWQRLAYILLRFDWKKNRLLLRVECSNKHETVISSLEINWKRIEIYAFAALMPEQQQTEALIRESESKGNWVETGYIFKRGNEWKLTMILNKGKRVHIIRGRDTEREKERYMRKRWNNNHKQTTFCQRE